MIKSKIFGGKPRIWPIIGLESILKMNTKTYPLKEVLLGCSQDQFIYKISKLYRTVTNGQDAVQLNLETVTVPVVFTEWNHYWLASWNSLYYLFTMHTSQQFCCLGDWCGPLQSFSHNILFYINKIHVFLDYQKNFFLYGWIYWFVPDKIYDLRLFLLEMTW